MALSIARALVLALVVLQPAKEPVNVSGVWNAALQLEVVTGHPTLTFKQNGGKITGTYEGRYGASPLEGTVKDKSIEFVVTMNAEGQQTTGTFAGAIDGDKMSGTVTFEGAGDGTWSATRARSTK